MRTACDRAEYYGRTEQEEWSATRYAMSAVEYAWGQQVRPTLTLSMPLILSRQPLDNDWWVSDMIQSRESRGNTGQLQPHPLHLR